MKIASLFKIINQVQVSLYQVAETTCQFQPQAAVPIQPRRKNQRPEFIAIPGKSSAPRFSNRLNFVKDMHILIEIFPPISFYNKALKLKLSSGKFILIELFIVSSHLSVIVNFQPFGLFCSLNIGVSGLI